MKPSRLHPLQVTFSEHKQHASPQRAIPNSRFMNAPVMPKSSWLLSFPSPVASHPSACAPCSFRRTQFRWWGVGDGSSPPFGPRPSVFIRIY